MAGWAAANSPQFIRSSSNQQLNENDDDNDKYCSSNHLSGVLNVDGLNSQKLKNKRVETAEAAIARLTHAYSTAMKCVGALHRMSASIEKLCKEETVFRSSGHSVDANLVPDMQTKTTTSTETQSSGGEKIEEDNNLMNVETNQDKNHLMDESFSHIIRVAQAARSALQETILLDPLVIAYAPTFHHVFISTLMKQKNSENEVIKSNLSKVDGNIQMEVDHKFVFFPQVEFTKSKNSRDKFLLSSAAHRSTVKEIAYLALINYADLLTCCSFSSCNNKIITKAKQLERGIVKTLPGLSLVIQSKSKVAIEASSCWEGEPLIITRKLALASYFDASELNLRSDPSLWLKLACAARALGKETSLYQMHNETKEDNQTIEDSLQETQRNDTPNESSEDPATKSSTSPTSLPFPLIPTHLRRIERYALEKGISSLPIGVPPSRVLLKSLEEWKDESIYLYQSQYSNHRKKRKREELKINLTRYSWSTLGRTLIRACKQGNGFSPLSFSWSENENHNSGQTRKKRQHLINSFGSPTVFLQISPMLALSPMALGIICEFLGSGCRDDCDEPSQDTSKLENNIKKFESTCRAISVAVISARARLEEEKNYLRLKAQHMIIKQNLELEAKLDKEQIAVLTPTKTKDVSDGVTEKCEKADTDKQEMTIKGKEELKQQAESETKDAVENSKILKVRTSRSSKRVQSQLITSGKAAERNAKRKSVEYNVLFNIMSCETNDTLYLQMCKEQVHWEKMSLLSTKLSRLTSISSIHLSSTKEKQSENRLYLSPLKDGKESYATDTTSRVGSSSMNSFIELWSGSNSGPFDLLWRFLVHVSLNVEDVFSSETDGVVLLSSCVMDCFELLNKKSGIFDQSVLGPSWMEDKSGFDFVNFEMADSKRIDAFAVNLLITELRMKRCERFGVQIENFDSDVSAVSNMVPHLISFSDALEKTQNFGAYKMNLPNLRSRTYWLASIYYLWFSRKTHRTADVSKAESLSLKYLDSILLVLQSSSMESHVVIRTPHLESPGREGEHWKELKETTLLCYRDSLQWMLVVTRAKNKFSILQMQIQNTLEKQSECNRFCPTSSPKSLGGKGNNIITLQKLLDGKTNQKMSTDLKLSHAQHALKAISDELLKRYSIEDECGHYHELISDFLACHKLERVKLSQQVKNNDSSTFGEQKWGKFWEVIPNFSLSDTPQIGKNNNQSLLSILAYCLSSESKNEILFLALLARLILTAFDERLKYLNNSNKASQTSRQTLRNELLQDGDSEGDSDDESCDGTLQEQKSRLLRKEETYLICIEFFLDKFSEILKNINFKFIDLEVYQFIKLSDLISIIELSVLESAAHIVVIPDVEDKGNQSSLYSLDKETGNQTPKLSLLLSSYKFSKFLVKSFGESQLALETAFFLSSIRVLVQYQKAFPLLLKMKSDKLQNRFDRQKACLAEAKYVGVITSLLANMMSSNLSNLSSKGEYQPSSFILSIKKQWSLNACKSLAPSEEKGNYNAASAPLFQLVKSLLWFWKFIAKANVLNEYPTEPETGVSDKGNNFPVSAIDRSVARQLVVPIGSAIIALCGSGLKATKQGNLFAIPNFPSEVHSSIEFFEDSDESVHDYFSDEETEGVDQIKDKSDAKYQRKQLLLSLCQSVRCVELVFGYVDEKNSSVFCPHYIFGQPKPILPLVVSRVLSNICEILLSAFVKDEKVASIDEQEKKKIWSEEYPYGTRTIGTRLDCLLQKAYKFMHGFTFGNFQYQIKDEVLTMQSTENPKIHFCGPESVVAAAQLYRCVKRTYFNSRKKPPSVVLEAIAAALPPAPESTRSKAIRAFLFSNVKKLSRAYKNDNFVAEKKSGHWLPDDFSEWAMCDKPPFDSLNKEVFEHSEDDNYQNETYLLRKGLSHELAHGPLPKLGDVPANSIDEPIFRHGHNNDRHKMTRYERALWKKFNCIINDLCYSPMNSKGWANAALCISSKADFICDRLATSFLSYDKEDFFIPPTKDNLISDRRKIYEQKQSSYKLAHLIAVQQKEFDDLNKIWIPCLGDDLSVYMRFSWSSFSSLLECATEIRENAWNDESSKEGGKVKTHKNHDGKTHEFLAQMYKKGNYSSWQRAWGGMFVQALRLMATRCLKISFFIGKKKSSLDSLTECDNGEKQLVAEVAETIATSLYGEIQGGVIYGFPMGRMPDLVKRNLAHQASLYYQEAMSWFTNPFVEDPPSHEASRDSNRRNECVVWPYNFMIGKCYEKMAGTCLGQSYASQVESSMNTCEKDDIRMYEKFMAKSLSSYAIALKDVSLMESEGMMTDQQGGGSSHGPTEAFYRLHASRLKILIRAVRRRREERLSAEIEAIRLISMPQQFEFASKDEQIKETQVRKQIWDLFGDLVAAMAQSRVKSSFFHRSVYRHAQSLLLASIVNDPYDDNVYRLGSLGSIPITKAVDLRGLSTESCAKSAASIIGTLFDRKRVHICAVWVTTPSKPSSFEVLNDSSRKYDRLRLKYVGAYIDCMRLCRRIDTLETFISWIASCRRDLASFYDTSAELRGTPTRLHHIKDCILDGFGLIWYAKRYANNSISCIIIDELEDSNLLGGNATISENVVLDYLKKAYTCFARLRCQMEDERLHTVKENLVVVEALLLAFQCYNKVMKISEPSESDFERAKGGDWRNHVHPLLRLAVSTCTNLIPMKIKRVQDEEKQKKVKKLRDSIN